MTEDYELDFTTKDRKGGGYLLATAELGGLTISVVEHRDSSAASNLVSARDAARLAAWLCHHFAGANVSETVTHEEMNLEEITVDWARARSEHLHHELWETCIGPLMDLRHEELTTAQALIRVGETIVNLCQVADDMEEMNNYLQKFVREVSQNEA